MKRRTRIPDDVAEQIIDDAVNGRVRRDLLSKLSSLDLPAELWSLPIDWRRNADWFDACAEVRFPHRSPKEQKRDLHAMSSALLKASRVLGSPGYSQIEIGDALSLIFDTLESREIAKYEYKGIENIPLWVFIECLANIFSGDALRWLSFSDHEGDHVRVCPIDLCEGRDDLGMDLPRRTKVRQDGAATLAARKLRRFMIWNGLGPRDALVEEIVSAYYPDATPRDRSRGARRNTEKSGKK